MGPEGRVRRPEAVAHHLFLHSIQYLLSNEQYSKAQQLIWEIHGTVLILLKETWILHDQTTVMSIEAFVARALIVFEESKENLRAKATRKTR